MKKIAYSLFIFSGITLLVACSTKKNSFVNRNFHAVTTEYNVLFNGQEAFNKGEQELFSGYQDNFWEVLPVERVQKLEELAPGTAKNDNFVRAETKATKAIQKHSMYIGGKERNSQIDEAYLLLGKSRYHDGRYLNAIEALNYVLYKYPESSTINEVMVWIEKSNIRLGSNETAIDNLKQVLKTNDKNFKGEIVADVHAVLAQAYFNTSVVDTTLMHLQTAYKLTNKPEKKARYAFILGQLNNQINLKDSANYYFTQVIEMNRKAPRLYTMQAQAEISKNFDYEKGDTIAFTKKFHKLLNDRENRPYLDILNHQMGVFYDKQNVNENAKKYYKAALKNRKSDSYLALSSYRNMGQMFFDERKFVTAGKYYDSSLVLFKGNEKEFFHLQRKRKNLDDVIKYEGIIANADSLTTVLGMTPDQKVAYYTAYIDKIKERDIKLAIEAKELAKKQQNIDNNNNSNVNAGALNAKFSNINAAKLESKNVQSRSALQAPNDAMMQVENPTAVNTTNSLGQSTFYYYIPASVQQGKMAFERNWGKREHKENWRWSNVLSNNTIDSQNQNQDLANLENGLTNKSSATEEQLIDLSDPKYLPETYISQLPKGDDVIPNLIKDRNAACYELGFIYKDKFQEYQLAADRLERLLISEPETRLILPAKYNLYKIYQIIDASKANIFKQQIITDFPSTHYAKVLTGEVVDTANAPETAFTHVYNLYTNEQLNESLAEVNKMIDIYAGNDILPKFELLKARILARTAGVAAYKESLISVQKLYPLTDEGKEAKRILESEVSNLSKLTFNDTETTNWKLFYDLSNETDKSKADLETKIKKYIAESFNTQLKLSTDYYDANKQLLVLHGFLSKETALAVNSILQDVKGYKIKQAGTPVSLHNYKVIQMHKKLDEYKSLNK